MVLQKLNWRGWNVDEVSWFCEWLKWTVSRKPCILVDDKGRSVVKIFCIFPFRNNKSIIGDQLKKIIWSLSCFKWNQAGIWKNKTEESTLNLFISWYVHNKSSSFWCTTTNTSSMRNDFGLTNENSLNPENTLCIDCRVLGCDGYLVF